MSPSCDRARSCISPARCRWTPQGGIRGVVGEDVDLEAGVAAARLCAINLIAQMKAACDGDLDRVMRVVKLGGFVQAGPDFFDIPKVVNGCSDLMVEVFGDPGRHARSAVGVYRLPLNFAVEVDAVVRERHEGEIRRGLGSALQLRRSRIAGCGRTTATRKIRSGPSRRRARRATASSSTSSLTRRRRGGCVP